MRGNCNALRRRLRRFQDDMAARLVNPHILPMAAQMVREPNPGDIARNPHATDRTSSRTRWSRIRAGAGWSKKNAVVASTTFLRNSSQLLAWVKMFSVRHSAQ